MEKIMQIQEKMYKTKTIEITNFKEKRLFIMDKSFKVVIIISKLKHINNSNITFI